MIRKASLSDIPAIKAMAEVVFRRTYKDILSAQQMEYMMDWMYSEDSLREQMSVKAHNFYIEDGKGYVSFRYDGIANDGKGRIEGNAEGSCAEAGVGEALPVYHLEKLYVMPEFHGTGLGRELFNEVVDQVRKLSGGKAARIELNVNRNNPAVSFYEHLGMYRKSVGDFPIGHGYFMNDYIMAMEV